LDAGGTGDTGGPSGPTTPPPAGESDDESLARKALDLLLFAPAGLVTTALEDLPQMIDKGRTRFELHLRNARFIGQFVVTKGQNELRERVLRAARVNRITRPDDSTDSTGSTGSTGSTATAGSPGTPGSGHRAPATSTGMTGPRSNAASAPRDNPAEGTSDVREDDPGPSAGTVAPDSATGAASAVTPDSAVTATPRTTPSAPEPDPMGAAGSAVGGISTGAGTAASSAQQDELAAIPGYDTLSASQVVRRLEGLGQGELEAILRYEGSHRGRRTILHRTQQLLGIEALPGSTDPAD
jgi:hypothetical protein